MNLPTLAVYDLTFTEHKPSLKSTVEILKWKGSANRVTCLIKYPEEKKPKYQNNWLKIHLQISTQICNLEIMQCFI